MEHSLYVKAHCVVVHVLRSTNKILFTSFIRVKEEITKDILKPGQIKPNLCAWLSYLLRLLRKYTFFFVIRVNQPFED